MDFDKDEFLEFFEKNKDEPEKLIDKIRSTGIFSPGSIISDTLDKLRQFEIATKKVNSMLYYLDACGEECVSIDILKSFIILYFKNGIKNEELKTKLEYHKFLLEDDDNKLYIEVFPQPRENNRMELLADIIFSTQGTR